MDNQQPYDLKYRPRRFEDLLGNTTTINYITKMLLEGKFPQFIILSGPPGCGKTTTAFLIAKALQCETYNGTGICGYCESCKNLDEVLYNTGKGDPALGVNTFDMGLNTDEEYINDIATSIQSGAFLGKKVMIIEELQKTRKDSQESLLNTLEFIPDDVYVIITTTEINKIITALRTRAVDLRFNYPSSVELKDYISKIAMKEGVKVNKEHIDILIKHFSNNPRQILKTLESVKNSGPEGLNFLREMDSFDYETYIEYFKNIQNSLIETIFFIEGLDSKVKFLQNMKYFIKDYIVMKYAPTLLGIKKDKRDKIQKALQPYEEGKLLEILDDLINVGYINEVDAGVKLLSLSNKFNQYLFRTMDMSDNLTPNSETLEELEPEIEEVAKTINNTFGTVNISNL